MLFQRQTLLILLAGVTTSSVGAFTTTPTTFISPSFTRSLISDSRLASDNLSNLSVESSSEDDAVAAVVDAAVAAAAAPAEAVEEEETPEDAAVPVEEEGTSEDAAVPVEEEEIATTVEASSDDAVEATEPAEATEEAAPAEDKNAAFRKKREQKPHTAYVVNLSYATDNRDLRTAFGEYGTVISVYMPMDRKNDRPKGIAFVSMSSEPELEAALEGMVDAEIDGRKVFVNKAKKKGEKSDSPRDPMTKLYIGNISFESTSQELLDHFSQYGAVKDCYVPTDRDTSLPRGFAFITMAKQGCDAAIAGSDGMIFGGREIEVKHSLPRGTKAPKRDKAPQTKLYIGNLSYETEEDVIREVFEQYGTLNDLYMPIDRYSGEKRGFAFVTVHPDVAAQIVEELDGFELDGRMLRVNEARPKGQAAPDEDDNYDDSYDGSYDETAAEGSSDESYE